GYNVHFIIPDKCQLGKIPHKTIDWLFLDRDLDVTASIDALIIDLSLVMERLNIISKSSRLDVNLKIVENSLNLEVNAHIQHDEKNISLRAGGVHLRHIMYNNQYKAVRILTKSEFILEMDLSGKLEMKPVQKIVDPLNPVVILDMDTVEYGQTIFFTDRALINYDLVRVSESILVITNLASNMMKGLFLDAGTVPFLTVVLKQYTDEKMRSLKLKFEQDLQFDLDKLDQKRIISLTDFKSKIETMNQRMKQKPFIFRQDFRCLASAKQRLPGSHHWTEMSVGASIATGCLSPAAG
uniref:Uncharacterized protein n=1 Tax=Romanomermis culicivorax TaxID=13658 RepID=A0A915JJX6_ROMCU